MISPIKSMTGPHQAGRAWIWMLLLLALLGGLGGYWYTDPYAAPEWVRAWLPVMPKPTVAKPLYRWRDAQGQIHITDTPPEGRPYEKLIYRKDANVIPTDGETR